MPKQPEPFGLFTESVDNALVFEVFFWISVTRSIERRRLKSQVRFNIDALFREAGIVIAFAQRELHVYAQSPVPAKLVCDGEPKEV